MIKALERLPDLSPRDRCTPSCESGIAGNFDAAFDMSNTRPDAVKAALEEAMGLTLIRARRKIERITIDRMPAASEGKSAAGP